MSVDITKPPSLEGSVERDHLAATALRAHLAANAPQCGFVWTSRIGDDLIRVAAYRTAEAMALDDERDDGTYPDDHAEYRATLRIVAEVATEGA